MSDASPKTCSATSLDTHRRALSRRPAAFFLATWTFLRHDSWAATYVYLHSTTATTATARSAEENFGASRAAAGVDAVVSQLGRGGAPLRFPAVARKRHYWCTQPSRLIHVCEYEKCFPCEKKARKHTAEKGSARSLDWHHFPKIDPKIALQTLPGGQRRAPQAKRSPRTCPAGPCRPRVGIALLRAPNLARVAADRARRTAAVARVGRTGLSRPFAARWAAALWLGRWLRG